MASARPRRALRRRPARPLLLIMITFGVLLVFVIAYLVRLGPYGSPDGDGVGDPYFPNAGGAGYDALNYRIDLSYDEPARSLSGTTTMTAVATEEIDSVNVDLDLAVTATTINDQPSDFRQRGRDVRVESADPLRAGQEFTVTVTYAGVPQETSPEAAFGVDRELIIADEPFGAPAWFASNDHPSDPATMEMTLRVPADLQALSSGSLISRDIGQEENFDTWHWRSDDPMATYLNFLAIGSFEIETGEDGWPFLYAVSSDFAPAERDSVNETLRRTPANLRALEEVWGPYPFEEIGGIVPKTSAARFGALETQPRPVYDSGMLLNSSDHLIVHEYAHMWFGNNVTLAQWGDLFMNEAYASFSEWIVAERRGGPSANQMMREMYAHADQLMWSQPMTDPGPEALFFSVYTRGPMALQALRNLMGDEAFFRLGREWANEPGTRSMEEWQDRAREISPVDLEHYFDVWLERDEMPAQTSLNGFR